MWGLPKDKNIARMNWDETLQYCRGVVGDVRVMEKSESRWMKFLGLFIPGFMDGFITTMYNPFKKRVTVYYTKGMIGTQRGASYLWHEVLGHGVDWQKHPVWFPLSYVLTLPAVLTMRSFWEFRGYRYDIIYRYHQSGYVPDELLEWIGSHFWGSGYFFMLPFRGWVRRILRRYRDEAYMAGRPAP